MLSFYFGATVQNKVEHQEMTDACDLEFRTQTLEILFFIRSLTLSVCIFTSSCNNYGRLN